MKLEEQLHDTQKCQGCGHLRHTTRNLLIRRSEWAWPVPLKICDICLDGMLTHLFENLPIEWTEKSLRALGIK